MFPLQLEKDQRYRYSHAEIFRQPGDLVHGFVMRNYRIGMHVQQFYEINIITRKVTRAGKLIDLPPLEYDLLEYLVRNAHRVVTRSMLMENVWEYSFDPSTNIVETRVCKLREKIDKPFGKELIHTVRGIGYVLE